MPEKNLDVLEKLAFSNLREQRANRRWRIILRLLTLAVVVWIVWSLLGLNERDSEVVGPHAALVEIEGTLVEGGSSSASSVMPALREAFSNNNSVGVIIKINSPGGSPVQAGLINDEITRLRALHPQKMVHVVVGDVCASGGYYIAAAADKIFVNKASIVGSIGVVMESFGFTEAMEKLGIERRTLTAGDNKAFMDPFSPVNEGHRQFAQEMINDIHQQFITAVKQGRGERLKETPQMFSGLIWSGAQAVELGLADGLGSVESVSETELNVQKVVDYTSRQAITDIVLKKFGGAVGMGLGNALSMQYWQANIK